jgi:hypothetical protein
VNENAKNSNNSVGTLLDLFRIGLEWAATEASPRDRLPALRQLLRSDNEKDQLLGLKVANAALATDGHGFRIVGPEHQGLKQRANLWKPQTYNEWWEAYTEYLTALVQETAQWKEEMRSHVSDALLQAAESQLLVRTSTEIAFGILVRVSQEATTDRRRLNRFFVNWIDRNEDEEHAEQIVKRVRVLQRQVTTASIRARFQRYVLDTGWNEWNSAYRDKRGKGTGHARQLVVALAHRIARDPSLFEEIEAELCREDESREALWHFGENLAEMDVDNVLLPRLLDIAVDSKRTGCVAGYLSAVWKREPSNFEQLLTTLLVDQDKAWLAFRLQAPYDSRRFDLMTAALRNSWVRASDFGYLCYGHAWKVIQAEQLRSLFELLVSRGDTDSRRVTLDLLENIPFDCDAPIAAECVLELVCQTLREETEWRDTMFGYHWSRICKKLVAWIPEYVPSLFDAILLEMKERYALSYDHYVAPVARDLVELQPDAAWVILKRHIEEAEPKWRGDLYGWMKGGHGGFDDRRVSAPISYFPIEDIFAWIREGNSANRAAFIAHAAPKGLDDADGGALTRRLLVEFSDVEGVTDGISGTFSSGGWTGPMSAHLREKRERLRTWLGSGFEPAVAAWIEQELTHYDRRIEDAEVEEEREHWD